MSGRTLRVVFFLTAFLLFTRFGIDPDFGWHLAYGQKYLETGQVYRADEFSWTMPGYIWGNYFFLYQALVAYIFSKLGYLVLGIIFGIIASASILLLLPKKIGLGQVLVGLLGVSAMINLILRPSTISFLMAALLLVFLKNGFHKKLKFVPLGFLFFALWANFHQGFVLGLVVLLAFLLFEYLRQRKKGRFLPKEGALFFLASLAGTFFTPYSFLIWKGVIMDIFGWRTWTKVSEWRPIVVHFPENIFFLIAVATFIVVFYKKFRRVDQLWFLTAGFMLVWSFVFTHTVQIWTEIFVFVTARNVKFDLKGSFFEKIPFYIALISVFLAIFLNFLIEVLKSYDLRARLEMDGYPAAASAFLKDNKLTERVFNEYIWGGYLDWTHPEIKVFIDGRMTGWRTNDTYILNDYIKINNGDCELAKMYQIETALLKKNSEAKCFSNYKLVYEDQVAKVFTKN